MRPLLVVLAATAAITACSDDAEPASDSAATTLQPDASIGPDYAGFCDAIATADAGDLAAAEAAFDHGPLHKLAEAVTDIDRSLAAQLLEAKERVESDFADGAPAASVTDGLRYLAVVTRDVLAAVGTPVPPFCQETTP